MREAGVKGAENGAAFVSTSKVHGDSRKRENKYREGHPTLFAPALFLCFVVFALGREGEDRTGALVADREAALYEVGVKEAELAKKEALLEEGKARAAEEARKKVRTHAVLTRMCDLFYCACILVPVRVASCRRTPESSCNPTQIYVC